jgi:hypothetical protein
VCTAFEDGGTKIGRTGRHTSGDGDFERCYLGYSKRIKPNVCILMFSGIPDVPENARLNVDAFLRKGQSPLVVPDKIQELLESPHQAA